MHKLTHLHAWQFFLLDERLCPLIEEPRDGKLKQGPFCKHDYLHHMFFCLKWLNDGNSIAPQRLKLDGASHHNPL
jgi:hypothetical protein